MKAKNIHKLNETYHDLIQRHVISGYDKSDERLSTGICEACQVTLMEDSRKNFDRDIHFFDHSQVKLSYQTRSKSQQKCECLVCKRTRCTIGPIVGSKAKNLFEDQKSYPIGKKKSVKVCNKILRYLHLA